MSASVERAKELFLQGYSCSQAVVGAFCDQVGMDFETAMRLAAPFGGGMGRMRHVCGAVSGATLVLSYLRGYSKAEDSDKKITLYKELREFYDRFEKETGSIICRELLALEEKPAVPKSHWCTPPFYIYIKEDVRKIGDAIQDGCGTDAPGSLVSWMCRHSIMHSMEMPGKRYDIGSKESYEYVCSTYQGIKGNSNDEN